VRKGDTSPSDRSCMSTRNRISSISSQSFSLEQREYRIHNHEPSTEFYSDYKRTTYKLKVLSIEMDAAKIGVIG
jgi:hypothetical protein